MRVSKDEVLEIAREIQSGYTRSYVQGARVLAEFLIARENRDLERAKMKVDERQLTLPLSRKDG